MILRLPGVSKELIDRFSKRHRQIDEKTRELLEREPDKANQNIKVIRANIAHKERARKIKDVGIVKLQSIWNKQLSWKERWQISRLDKHRSPEISQKMTAEQAVNWAEQHLFERRSVVHEHELWRHALEHTRGQTISLPEIKAATRKREYLRDEQFQGKITTREVFQREFNIVRLAQHRMRQYEPLAPIISRQTVRWMMNNARPSNTFYPRVISSPCFAAAQGRAKVLRCGKSKPDSFKPVIPFKSSHHNASRSPIWNGTALPAHKPSVLCSSRIS